VRSAQSTLAVHVSGEGPTVAVRLDGELDITSAPLLQTVVDQVLAQRRRPVCTFLEIDLSGVSFADASGLSPILLARALLARRGGRLELRHPRRCVSRVLRLLGMDEVTPGPRPEDPPVR
jgi:anti-sigma B factor antagonist